MEKLHILRVLDSVHGNKTQASKLLGIARHHLRRKLKKYSIEQN
jgi:DNA-binding protein Fis